MALPFRADTANGFQLRRSVNMAILTQSFIALVILAAVAGMAQAQVVNSEWNTGIGNWNVPANWFPNAVPNNGGGFTYNVQIGNRPVAAMPK